MSRLIHPLGEFVLFDQAPLLLPVLFSELAQLQALLAGKVSKAKIHHAAVISNGAWFQILAGAQVAFKDLAQGERALLGRVSPQSDTPSACFDSIFWACLRACSIVISGQHPSVTPIGFSRILR